MEEESLSTENFELSKRVIINFKRSNEEGKRKPILGNLPCVTFTSKSSRLLCGSRKIKMLKSLICFVLLKSECLSLILR